MATEPPAKRKRTSRAGKKPTGEEDPAKPAVTKKGKTHIKGDKYAMIGMMDGKSVETALTMKLPDYLAPNLDVIFIGINPGVVSAARGHHYFNPTNHFWPLMFQSGLIDERMTAKEDAQCLAKGFGLTNMVARTSHAASDLSRSELKDGAKDTVSMLQELRPKVACFNGKGIYETFSGTKKCTLGRQEKCISDTDVVVYVMPSTSARAAQFPSVASKLRFFTELKEIIDECNKASSPVANASAATSTVPCVPPIAAVPPPPQAMAAAVVGSAAQAAAAAVTPVLPGDAVATPCSNTTC
ncbi:G/T mismatch-specific thymine DNA glycosylase-like [Sycon ciliatum]|uniref:G/T mismatch-specific thymine DNA glycosylase-like n=1 Tax=Sycon ciliatum TaxID=27933 RepID=UPI0031F6793B|eukprot:scpid7588/ scgid10030/ G/T mismatch-specific thymine DNA glycosylase; C-JUN leucine zipper interactive protein JZA-3; Thymine-DNA glycosylase